MPLQPTVISNGIKYIKINKQDFNGLDLNTQINELNALRIQYDNGTITQFNLIGEPDEYSDYYLLRVSPASPYTSSADNTILDYKLIATGGGSSFLPTSLTRINGWVASSNPGGYFNTTTGIYDIPNLTNISVQITGSATVTEDSTVSPADAEMYLVSNIRGNLGVDSVSLAPGATDTLDIKYNGYFLEGEDISLYWVANTSDVAKVSTAFNFTQSIAPTSSTENLIIFEPYNTSNFTNSDYNAILNDVSLNRSSTEWQLVDYTTNQLIPINFAQLISGSATRAAVQDSNYTSYQYSGIRYWGSKNTTDDFNSTLTVTASIVQTYQNDNIGITTLGYPSVNKYDSSILEFNWGGGTYPEIYGGGALSLNQLLGVGTTRDNVSRFNSTEPGFNKSVEILFPINSLPVFNQYSTTATTTVNARVSSIGFTVPSVSNYMIASPTVSTTAQISASTDYITITGDLSEVNTNINGNYITGSLINSSSFMTSISQGFASGERWFVTFYQNLPNLVIGVLEPLDLGYSNYTVENGYSYPLAAKGVFEITSSLISTALPTSSFRAGQSTAPLPGRIGFINTGVFGGPAANTVTNLYINDIDDNSNNISSSLEVLNDSQIITLENTTAGTGPFVYNITGTPVDNGTYFTIPVSWVSGAGNLRISGDGGVTFDNYDVYTDGNSRLYLDIPGGTFTTGSQFGNGNNGMLVWKSQGGAYMTFNDATLSGVGKGGLVTSTPSPIIQKDFTYITQTFGNNPKTQ